MGRTSRGPRRRTRKKLQKRARERGLSPITRRFVEYAEGDLADIVIDPSVQRGQPHPRFHGLTGRILARRGRAYLVRVKTGNMFKQVIVRPEHLRKSR
ncbi:MAG: 50S ribosomal protein L21e [Candidatus Thermoplasmatota archaeon]|nr:50S ribosomal protein L21e [Candidatus Thermoplasmatota archaeon]